MKTYKFFGLLIILVLLIAAMPVMSAGAGADKVDVCHLEGNGSYHLINISDNAYPAHIDHGDVSPGNPVPGMPGFVFDEGCNIVQPPPPVCPSIISKSAKIEVLDTIPTDVRVGAFESDEYVRVWKEFEGTLTADLAYDLEEGRSAKADGPAASPMAIPAGTDVCVYYVHLDNIRSSSTVQQTGFLEFATDISGLIISGGNLGTFANKNLMFAADDQIGYSGTTYPDDSTIYPPNVDYLRGFDVKYGSNLDDAWFNGARVDFTMWVVNAHDSLRVILPLVPAAP